MLIFSVCSSTTLFAFIYITRYVRCLLILSGCSQNGCRWNSEETLAGTHVPPNMTNLKLCEDSIFGNSLWHCVLQNYGFILVKKLVTFSYVAVIVLPRKFKLIF